MHFSFIVFSTITAFKQTQTGLLTALNLFSLFTTLQLHCSFFYFFTLGTFAVIGMASFMGGSGRITVMLATVILELKADVGLIAPVRITCVIAMLMGNLFNRGTFKIEKLKNVVNCVTILELEL